METGIAKAARSKFGHDNEIKVLINRDSGDIKIYRKLIIAETPENSNLVKQLDEKEVVHNYFYTPDQCSICLSMISDSRKKLLCGHSFHNLCISQWLARDQRCPVCRTIHVEKPNRRNSEPVVSRPMDVESDSNNNNRSLPSLNVRHRYNNYVIPRNNYVDRNAYYRRTVHESKYCYKK